MFAQEFLVIFPTLGYRIAYLLGIKLSSENFFSVIAWPGTHVQDQALCPTEMLVSQVSDQGRSLVAANTTEQRIIGGKIFAVWVPYEGVTLKRVFMGPEKKILLLQSENPKHPDQRLPIDGVENLIVGRVKWVMQEV
ncbi:MAG: helix-turn-helix transcriptional regulator [Desulfovermiculus sp.]